MTACALAPVLSVHDTAPVVEGSDARTALRRSRDLARLADALGFRRYWIAEHHGMRGVASCAPSVLVGDLAWATDRIRVGAGGVLLPSHAPLVVAEQFGSLEALHPGRIDLALGRAPGGPRRAAEAVHPGRDMGVPEFRRRIEELGAYFERVDPGGVRAVPAFGNRPVLWLLGSGPDSATLAGTLGLPYAFGGHLNPGGAVEAVRAYRSAHDAGGHPWPSYAIVSVSVIASDTDAHADWLAGSQRLKVLRRRDGQRGLLPPPGDDGGYPPDRLAAVTAGYVIGGPSTVRDGLADIATRTGADELMITTPVHDHDRRRESFRIVADLSGRIGHQPPSRAGQAGPGGSA